MGLIKCKECKKEISDKADVCPNCGYPLEKERKSMNDRYTIILYLIILIIGYLALKKYNILP